MAGMSGNPQDEQAHRAMRRGIRSLLLLAILTVGSLSFIRFKRHGFYPPHGNPLVYALAMSWLISFAIAMLTTAIYQANPELFPLARWEREGKVYDRWSVRAFRWALLHSPLGWINVSLYLNAGRTDCKRLLKDMNLGERVHWLTLFFTTILGISYFVGHHAVYGYAMLLVRIPFDLYPIMLLRQNRGRPSRVLTRQLRTTA
jgi:hypothetical protein